jgi:hypothetical protein
MSEKEQSQAKHTEHLTPGGEADLPPELKAIEAELAALRPRSNRLDRERLIFLAGQQAATEGKIDPVYRHTARHWPAGFAAMTAVASVLLVMLLIQAQAEPRTEIKYVEVPVKSVAGGQDTDLPSSPPERGPVDRSPGSPEPTPEPASRPGLLASAGFGWLLLADRTRLGQDAPYPRLLDRVLREGIDTWELPVSTAGPAGASAPLPYRELRDRLLGKQTPERARPDHSLMHTMPNSGANS